MYFVALSQAPFLKLIVRLLCRDSPDIHGIFLSASALLNGDFQVNVAATSIVKCNAALLLIM